MTKTVYSYNDQGLYVGPITLDESDKSPLEPDTYLIPANCTEKEPLPAKENHFVVFKDDEWTYVEIPSVDPEMVRKLKLNQLPSLMEGLSRDGFSYNKAWFRTDIHSKLTYISLAAAEEFLPNPYPLATLSGELVELGHGSAKKLLAASAMREQALWGSFYKHVKNLETTDDPVNYDISEGWPETFSTQSRTAD